MTIKCIEGPVFVDKVRKMWAVGGNSNGTGKKDFLIQILLLASLNPIFGTKSCVSASLNRSWQEPTNKQSD